MPTELETVVETEEQHPDSDRGYDLDILKIIRSTLAPKAMQEKLEDYHENDIANALEELSTYERQKLFRVLDTSVLSEVFEYVDEERAAAYLNELDLRKVAAIISGLETDTMVTILRTIPKERRELIIDLFEPSVRADMRVVAAYDEDEIGSRMTTNCIILKNGLTVREGMYELVRQAGKNDNIATIFVEDDYGSYYGAIDLKELIIAPQEGNLDELVVTSFPYFYGHESIDDCIERLKDYSENFVPVLDNDNRIQGVITSQSIIQVVDDEMGEDYARFAGLTAEEDLTEPLKESMKKRMPWLLVLLGLGMLVSTVVSAFEGVVSVLPIVMAFQSLILDMAGNAGTQSLAVTIRVLVDENLTFKEKVGLVFKETRVGLCNGLVLGILAFGLLGVYIMVIKGRDPMHAFAISACIGFAMMVAMVISSGVGTLIPMLFKRIGVDPAVASGPLITTMNDLVAVVTYYGLSWLLLIQIMQIHL